ncbi:MAG: GtrA family protein [Janthinobacterium lividum]
MIQPAALSASAMKKHTVMMLYVFFALLSTGINLGTQQIAMMLFVQFAGTLPLSLLAGTVAGFVAKYILDKNFIFFDHSVGRSEEVRKVALYGFFSVFTTVLFWAVEIGAFRLFGTVEAKYTGAVLGLGLGYALKFMLDRRFTFTGAQR